MEANLRYGVRNVRTCECQILQCTSNASVGSGVIDEHAIGCGWLWLCVCWSSNSIAVLHASTLKYVLGVLGLRQEEAMLMTVHAEPWRHGGGTQRVTCPPWTERSPVLSHDQRNARTTPVVLVGGRRGSATKDTRRSGAVDQRSRWVVWDAGVRKGSVEGAGVEGAAGWSHGHVCRHHRLLRMERWTRAQNAYSWDVMADRDPLDGGGRGRRDGEAAIG